MKNIVSMEFLEQYSIESKRQNSNETILRDKKTNKLVLMKQLVIQDTVSFKNMIENLSQQKQLQNEHLMSLIEYETGSTILTEDTIHTITTFYNYSSHTLLQQIQQCIQDQKPFDQGQIWSIMGSLVLGLSYLQKQGIAHGCVHPSDIYSNNEGQIKIIDPSLSSANPFTLSQSYYYSPQMMQWFNDGIQTIEFDIFKSDVFSLGVSMLHICLLESCENCYNYEEPEILLWQLQNKLELAHEFYSKQLLNFIKQMLVENSKYRVDFIQLEKQIKIMMNNSSEQSLRSSLTLLTIGQKQKFTISPLIVDEQDLCNSINQPVQKDQKFIDQIDRIQLKQNKKQQKIQQKQNNLMKQNLKQSSKLSHNMIPLIKNTMEDSLLDNKQINKKLFCQQSNVETTNNNNKTDTTKKYFFNDNNYGSYVENSPYIENLSTNWSNKPQGQVYTDPKLLMMMRQDVERIVTKRNQFMKENVN